MNQTPKHKPDSINHELKISEVMDSLPFYTLIVDEDHNILEANAAVQSHLGVDPKDIVGGYCPRVIHGLDDPFEGCPLEDSVLSGEAIEKELYDAPSNFWFKSAIYPINGVTVNGKRVYFHMVTDITGRKKAEKQLEASQKELRSLLTHVQSVREEERKRIARDLHDETAQVVASLITIIENAVNTLPTQPKKSEISLRRAQALCVRILDELQRLVHELRPAMLDDLGLVPAIESLVENTLEPAGIKTIFKTTGAKRRLPAQLETTLFRVMQEAVSNIAKHAKAKKVNIEVRFKKGLVEVLIADNGKGFDVKKAMDFASGIRGYGLLNMRERILDLGDSFNVNSDGKSGTTIEINIADTGKS
ncbi:ATP-binding protein [Chloroflexota bacterium]